MKVVIVGERLRSDPDDPKLVVDLMLGLKEMYSDLYIITTGCDRGVGKIIKNYLMPGSMSEPPIIDFEEIAQRIFAKDRPKAFYANRYLCRNPMLLQSGEEFHLFLDDKRGAIWDLYELVKEQGLPHSVYMINEHSGPKLLK